MDIEKAGAGEALHVYPFLKMHVCISLDYFTGRDKYFFGHIFSFFYNLIPLRGYQAGYRINIRVTILFFLAVSTRCFLAYHIAPLYLI